MEDGPNCERARVENESTEVPVGASGIPDVDRRELLGAIGGFGTVVLAGCLGNDDDETSYLVVFVDHQGRTEIEVREDEELLYPALDAGVDIPYSCEVGRCGECTAKYDGDATDVVVHDGNHYLDDEQIANGWVLTCVAYPRDDFELEVAHPDDE